MSMASWLADRGGELTGTAAVVEALYAALAALPPGRDGIAAASRWCREDARQALAAATQGIPRHGAWCGARQGEDKKIALCVRWFLARLEEAPGGALVGHGPVLLESHPQLRMWLLSVEQDHGRRRGHRRGAGDPRPRDPFGPVVTGDQDHGRAQGDEDRNDQPEA